MNVGVLKVPYLRPPCSFEFLTFFRQPITQSTGRRKVLTVLKQAWFILLQAEIPHGTEAIGEHNVMGKPVLG